MPPILDGRPCAVPSLSFDVVRGCLVWMNVICNIHDSTHPTRAPALVLLVKEALVLDVRRMCRPVVILHAVTAVRVNRLFRFLLFLFLGFLGLVRLFSFLALVLALLEFPFCSPVAPELRICRCVGIGHHCLVGHRGIRVG